MAAASYQGKRFGPFLMEKEIGAHGGMSTVYIARIVSSEYPENSRNLRAAVKIVREGAPQYKRDFEDMLIRETDLLSKLHHPGIVRIFPVLMNGKTQWWRRQTIDGSECPYYYAMEYLPKNLSEVPVQTYPITWRVELIAQIAQALYFLHMLNIAHRDIKPENILLRTEPNPKSMPQPVLIDFGISEKRALRHRLHDERALTVHWSSPERIYTALNTREFNPTTTSISYNDFAADIWSFGMLAYWILTGKYAFGDMNQPRTVLMDAIQRRPPEPMNLKDISPRLGQLVLAMLSKDPTSGKRPNIIEVVTQLQRDIEYLPPRL